jgi:hypothetical protein
MLSDNLVPEFHGVDLRDAWLSKRREASDQDPHPSISSSTQ